MNASKLTTLCAALLVAGLAGCDGNDDEVAALPDLVPPATTEPVDDMTAGTDTSGTITVATADDGGTYLTDSAGNAVYMLEGDPEGDACVGDCLETWPPVLVTDVQPSVDVGVDLDPALVGTMQRPDGTMQVTYNGFPLYRYAADTGANRIAGHGIDDQWGEWYLLTPTGEEFAMSGGTTADASMVGGADGEVEADSSVAEDATTDDGPADTSAIEEGTGDDY
ncbi:MAG TPA: hypothetical protein VFS99_03880 [Xanthomonadaceae bacterium]|nr:hypothetical protein [Xanthomonadaceae bacterium]